MNNREIVDYILREKIEIIKTCGACPEQYDVFVKENNEKIKIGYLRLRWGRFTVEYPSAGGECIYEKTFHDPYKGHFDNEEERQHYLDIAIRFLIIKYIREGM